MSDFHWFDPTINYYSAEWDEAWTFGTTASRLFPEQTWDVVAPKLEEMWGNVNVGSRKSWIEARPAIYSGWRASRPAVPSLKSVG